MKITETESAPSIRPRRGALKEYRRYPGGLNAAAFAALHFARRDKASKVIVEGNSYGSRVYHIANMTDDLATYTAMASSARVLVVKADGSSFFATAN